MSSIMAIWLSCAVPPQDVQSALFRKPPPCRLKTLDAPRGQQWVPCMCASCYTTQALPSASLATVRFGESRVQVFGTGLLEARAKIECDDGVLPMSHLVLAKVLLLFALLGMISQYFEQQRSAPRALLFGIVSLTRRGLLWVSEMVSPEGSESPTALEAARSSLNTRGGGSLCGERERENSTCGSQESPRSGSHAEGGEARRCRQ